MPARNSEISDQVPPIIEDHAFICNVRGVQQGVPFLATLHVPPVALTHIFCGQIKKKCNGEKQAEGRHSRPGLKDPTWARTTIRFESLNTAYVTTAVDIYDAEAKEWISKTTGHTEYYFFPGAWNIETTVDKLIDVYNHCNRASSRQPDLCIKNYVYDGGKPFDITLFLDQEKRIVSAFPMRKGSCPQKCEFVSMQCNKDSRKRLKRYKNLE